MSTASTANGLGAHAKDVVPSQVPDATKVRSSLMIRVTKTKRSNYSFLLPVLCSLAILLCDEHGTSKNEYLLLAHASLCPNSSQTNSMGTDCCFYNCYHCGLGCGVHNLSAIPVYLGQNDKRGYMPVHRPDHRHELCGFRNKRGHRLDLRDHARFCSLEPSDGPQLEDIGLCSPGNGLAVSHQNLASGLRAL